MINKTKSREHLYPTLYQIYILNKREWLKIFKNLKSWKPYVKEWQ